MIAHDALDLSRPRRLHMLGVGGSGMGPFARLLRDEGHLVTGADLKCSPAVEALRREGIAVLTGEEAARLPEGTEAVIHSAALPPTDPALLAARGAGLPAVKYARAVGLYAEGRQTFAVAGTHGKTTTTAMLACALRNAGQDPSFIVGGFVPQLGGGSGRGGSRRLVVEACEYDRSFLHFSPDTAIITNIEADHLDYYRDIVEICAAFRAFATRVTRLLIIHESLRETIGRAGGVRARVRTFGTSRDADFRLEALPRVQGRNVLRAAGRTWRLAVPGAHNILNAGAVLAVAQDLGLDPGAVADALENFRGVGRRLELVGRPRGVPVVDDYAHHPTEVAAGLRALREEYAPARLWCVFQPHQHSRTRRFLDEFAQVLATADRVVIPDIYTARDREEDRRAVTGEDLAAAVRTHGGNAVHMNDFGSIVDFLRAQIRAGDVVVTMGAGDVGDVAGRLAKAI